MAQNRISLRCSAGTKHRSEHEEGQMPDTVTVSIKGGPSATVAWKEDLTALEAMESAFGVINQSEQFTYALQYYGQDLGYLVVMINEMYDSFVSKGGKEARPSFYWEFLVNGEPTAKGVSHTVLARGDEVEFELEMFVPEKHRRSLLSVKHAYQTEGDRA